MSVEVNLKEKLTVVNKTEKTKELLKAVADYLINNWGIHSLTLTADETTYKTEEDSISKESELYSVLQKLDTYSNITYLLNSSNRNSIEWRKESSFMRLFTEDDLKQYVEYKSLEYCDVDLDIVAYVYDANGGRYISCDPSLTAVNNVTSWYSYNFSISITGEEDAFTDEICEALIDKADSFAEKYDFCNEIDEPYCGEMLIEGSMVVQNSDVKEFINQIDELYTFVINNELEMDLIAPFIADDYHTFAFAEFDMKHEKCVVQYAVF